MTNVVRNFRARPEAVLRRDESRSAALFEELLRLGTDEARQEAVMEGSRFRSPGLARRLLREAAEAKATDSGRARSLATLALIAASQADRERFPRAVLDGLVIQASCLLAEVDGLRGRPREARLWILGAVSYLNHHPSDALERAFLCRTIGLERRREGRRDEALALLGRAAEIFGGHGETAEAAETQVEEGWIYYDAAEPLRAYPLFRQALEQLPPGERPEVHLRCFGGLALTLEDLGHGKEADVMLAEGLALASKVPLLPDGHRFELVRARIAELRGRLDDTAEVLQSLVRRLSEEGCPFEAVTVALDLARLHLGEGRSPEPVLSSLPPLPAGAESAVREVWKRIERKDPDADTVLRRLQEDLGYARHDPGHRFAAVEGAP